MEKSIKPIGIGEHTVVNFLQTSVSDLIEWRYKTWQMLSNIPGIEYCGGSTSERNIYFIGIIQLSLINWNEENNYEGSYVIGIINDQHKISYHKELIREKDGTVKKDTKPKEIRCYFPKELRKALVIAKKDYNYFHILLEKRVTRLGEHFISLIYDPEKKEGDLSKYGIADNKLWIKSTVDKYVGLSHMKISNELGRFRLVYNDGYPWIK